MKNILIVVPHIPMYDINAGDWRIYCISKLLSRKFNVFILPLRFMWQEHRYIKEMENVGIRFLFPGYKRIFSFKKLIKKYNFEIIVFEWFYTAQNFIKFFPDFEKVIIDTHELQYRKLEQKFKLVDFFKNKKYMLDYHKKNEIGIYKRADLLITITEKEKNLLRKEIKNKRIITIPMCVDIPEVMEKNKNFTDRRNIVFFASFSNPEQNPNVDAVYYFLERIFQSILKIMPEVKFHIGGYNSEWFKYKNLDKTYNNVVIDGKIGDISKYLSKFKVFICPLRYGAGMKKKILDAMVSGLPVVTTSIGAEGINREVIITDSDKEFARKVTELYRDRELWNNVSKSELELVKEDYSMEIIGRKIFRIIK